MQPLVFRLPGGNAPFQRGRATAISFHLSRRAGAKRDRPLLYASPKCFAFAILTACEEWEETTDCNRRTGPAAVLARPVEDDSGFQALPSPLPSKLQLVLITRDNGELLEYDCLLQKVRGLAFLDLCNQESGDFSKLFLFFSFLFSGLPKSNIL